MKRQLLLILLALSPPLPGAPGMIPAADIPGTVQHQGGVAFSSSGGWLETGFAEWRDSEGASGYGVYCKPAAADDSAYVKVEAGLVRGTRVDIPGLLGNHSYDIRVVPVGGGKEVPGQASMVLIKTLAHDRSGFAFDKRSPRGTQGTSGRYQPDGQADPAATILHISDATKDSVQMAVTKGRKTETHTGLFVTKSP